MTIQHTKAEKAEQLTDAFRIFNEVSEHLAVSYQGLEEQVAKLHHELAFAHSERLQSLEEKEKLASRLEKIMAALPAGVVVLDADGKVLEANALALGFLGEPLLGLAWSAAVQRSLRPVFANPHEHLLANGGRVSMSYRQLPQGAGQIIVLSDVSEMRVLQDMLNQQKQLSALGEMAASMAHQVRTPLATAILYASQMGNPALDEEKRQQFSEKVLERLHHLERQVNDMLMFAKQGRMAMASFSLSELLNHLRVGAIETIQQRQIEVQLINKVAGDEFLGNANALRGALMNLVNNAVDALGQEGLVRISADLVDNNLQIAVTDNGPGIAKTDCGRIFQPFYSTKSNGTGLGLAVVDSVAKAHDGQVAVVSSVGLGTSFTLTLPCLKAEGKPLPGGFSQYVSQLQELHYESL